MIKKKTQEEDSAESFAQFIVLTSLQYRTTITDSNNTCSVDAGAEFVYLLLHMLDWFMHEQLDLETRTKIFEQTTFQSIVDYAKAVIKKEAPKDLVEQLCRTMLNTFDDRQDSYSKCSAFSTAEGVRPQEGTTLFALSFFIHKALQKTNRTNLDDELLSGKRKIDFSEYEKDFPNVFESLRLMIYTHESVIAFKKLFNETLFPNHQ